MWFSISKFPSNFATLIYQGSHCTQVVVPAAASSMQNSNAIPGSNPGGAGPGGFAGGSDRSSPKPLLPEYEIRNSLYMTTCIPILQCISVL
jgi:hypothetical protein